MSHEVLQPEGWARPRGYANGIAADGRQVFISGQIGWNAAERIVSDDFAAQARQAQHERMRKAGAWLGPGQHRAGVADVAASIG